MKYLKIAIVVLGAVAFFTAAAGKFMRAPAIVEVFGRFGLPRWFMMTTGAIESIGAITLLIPARRVRFTGACLLCATMIAGAGSHFAFDPPAAALPAIVLAIATAAIAAANFGGEKSVIRA